MRAGYAKGYATTPGGMPSPAVSLGPTSPYTTTAATTSTAPHTTSESPRHVPTPGTYGSDSLLPSDWPRTQTRSPTSDWTPKSDSVTFSQFAQVQAEKATLEVKLNVANNKLAEAEEDVARLAGMATTQREQYGQVVSTLLTTMRGLCSKTEVPEDVASPRRAAIVSGLVKKELTMVLAECEAEKELAVTTAEASTAKIGELIVAVNDRDICIATLEDKVNLLQEQVRALRTSPVRGERHDHDTPLLGHNADDSLLQWATQGGEHSPLSPLGATVRQPSPQRARPALAASPRNVQTPLDAGPTEWPPSPRRQHTEQPHSQLDDTLPEEFPPSPRRVIGSEAPTEWRKNGEEWPPSPRRAVEVVEEVRAAAAPSHDWSNVTATPDSAATKDWLMSPQKSREVVSQPTHEWPPSPQRVRQTAPSQEVREVQEWPPSPQRVRQEVQEIMPEETEQHAWPSPQRERAQRGEEWPPSPPRTRGGGGGGGVAPQRQQQPVQEWPPSPQRQRTMPEVVEEGGGGGGGGGVGEEWPPSPPRARKTDLHETVPISGDEWPPVTSPTNAKNVSPPVPSGEAKEWPPSPRRSRTPETAQHSAPARSAQMSGRKDQWPASPRRTPLPEAKQPGTPLEANRTATPIDVGHVSLNNSLEGDGVHPQRLEWPATSPKQSHEGNADLQHIPRHFRSDSAASSTTGSRRRSVGFVDVPPDDLELSRKHSAGDLGAARRAVDLIREPSELTPTAAKMKIHRLEEELRRLKGGSDSRFNTLDTPMRRRAEAIFSAVDSQCQKDGSISKAELGKVLGKEHLGAKVFFHELDANDSGEIDINEWLNWFGHLQKREAADNMLEWLEQELAAATAPASAPLDPQTQTRASDAFDRILNAASTVSPYVRKAELTTILTDGHSFMRELVSSPLDSGELVVKLSDFVEWIKKLDTNGTPSTDVMDWVEMKLASYDDKQRQNSPARVAKQQQQHDLHEAEPVRHEDPAAYPDLPMEGSIDQDLITEDIVTDHSVQTPDYVEPAAPISPPGEGGYVGCLPELLKTRAIECFHQLDQGCANSGEIPQEDMLKVLNLSEGAVEELQAVKGNASDVTMAEWMEWLDTIHSKNGADDLIASMEGAMK